VPSQGVHLPGRVGHDRGTPGGRPGLSARIGRMPSLHSFGEAFPGLHTGMNCLTKAVYGMSGQPVDELLTVLLENTGGTEHP
jgi:hypothetical protein